MTAVIIAPTVEPTRTQYSITSDRVSYRRPFTSHSNPSSMASGMSREI